MKKPTDMGMNRTGAQMSPVQSDAMMENTRVGPKIDPEGGRGLASLRGEYIAEAPPIGSVPPPATIKGAAKTGVQLLKGKKPTVLLDKLGERLAFERTGSRLYDALLAKLEASDDDRARAAVAMVRKFRDDELRHFALVWQALESLGADPTTQTPAADVAGVQSIGLLQTITDPRTTALQSLDAILHAELIDNEAWTMLISLAERASQNGMTETFRGALVEEQEHLGQIRGMVNEWLARELS